MFWAFGFFVGGGVLFVWRSVVGESGVGGRVVDAAAHVAVNVVLVFFGAVAVEEVWVVGEVDVCH